MPVVFVIAPDGTTRISIRAELRELGIDALGMDSAEDAGRGLSSAGVPDAVVLEAVEELLGDTRIQSLIQHVPTVLVASRTVKVPLPDVAVVLYRPVRIAEIVARVNEFLSRDHSA